MNIQKILLGGLAGGAVFFILGYLVYGMLLMDYSKENMNQCMAVEMADMVWWAMIVSNLCWGILLAVIMGWAGKSGLASGAKIGAVVGLLVALFMDLMIHSYTTMFLNMTMIIVDILAFTVISAMVGAAVGLVLGMGGKSAE